MRPDRIGRRRLNTRGIMKKLALLAAVAATFALTIPASAQGISVRVGEPGYHSNRGHHHGMRSRAQYRDRDVVVVKKRGHHRDWDRRRGGRTVIIQR